MYFALKRKRTESYDLPLNKQNLFVEEKKKRFALWRCLLEEDKIIILGMFIWDQNMGAL